jgi:hypothetical protein
MALREVYSCGLKAILLERPGIKPDWNLYRSLFLCKLLKIFLNTIFSNILLTQDNNETGLLFEGKDSSPFLNKGIT